MRRALPLIAVSILAMSFGCVASRDSREPGDRQTSLSVMSYNIRVNVESDGENAWPRRADRVVALLRFHGADVIGLQEATSGQIDDVVRGLPEYDWYGVGRDDGVKAGEAVPIFCRRDRFRIVERGSFWLSPTPDEPGSVGWDAALPRVTSWVLLEDLSGGRLYVFNTHFDHRGRRARTESARLLWRTVRSVTGETPAVVLGDFNTRPDSEPYRVMVQAPDGQAFLRDAAAVVAPYGPDFTFSSFEVGKEEEGRIDFVFVTPGATVDRVGTLTDQYRGSYPSDHLPVLAEITVADSVQR